MKPIPILLENQRSQTSGERHTQTSFLFVGLIHMAERHETINILLLL